MTVSSARAILWSNNCFQVQQSWIGGGIIGCGPVLVALWRGTKIILLSH